MKKINGYEIEPDANLRDANLIGADLRDANLRDANLRGADLRGADLRGADFNENNFVVFIYGTKHILQYNQGMLRIGCEVYPVEYWIKNYNVIGLKYDYSDIEISEYFKYIKMIADNFRK